jgi:hypothetical protein
MVRQVHTPRRQGWKTTVTSEVPVSVGSDTVVTVDTLLEGSRKERLASHQGGVPLILFYTLTSVTTLSDPYRMGTSHVTVRHGCHGLPLVGTLRPFWGRVLEFTAFCPRRTPQPHLNGQESTPPPDKMRQIQ